MDLRAPIARGANRRLFATLDAVGASRSQAAQTNTLPPSASARIERSLQAAGIVDGPGDQHLRVVELANRRVVVGEARRLDQRTKSAGLRTYRKHFDGVDDELATNYFDKLIQVPNRFPRWAPKKCEPI